MAVFGALMAFTGLATFVTSTLVGGEERRLLSQRTEELALVFTNAINQINTQMSSLARVAGYPPGTGLFDEEAAAQAKPTNSFALVQPAGGGTWQAVAATGAGLTVNEKFSGVTAKAMAQAAADPRLSTTPVMGSGSRRSIGFAYGGPAGYVIYHVTALGAVRPPAQAGTAPFSEVQIALYAVPRPDSSQVLVATTGRLPLTGDVRFQPIVVGSSKWLLAVTPVDALVGTVASDAPWLTLAAALVMSVLVATVIEFTIRRRDSAVALYEVEHRFAEDLQRRLLPDLPDIGELDIACRYVTASNDREVGGDWFDVFDLGRGATGVVIGDVMGHDVEAAAAMAQVRAVLRAYALEGIAPNQVMDRLANFFETSPVIVTALYGVLGPTGPAGSRTFSWANAGHPPPVLRHPGGQTTVLWSATGPLLGAPREMGASQAETVLPAGGLLVLYTDGLVEVPGVPIDHSIDELAAAVSRQADGTSSEEACDALLSAQLTGERRDDVAVVVVRSAPLEAGDRASAA